MFDDSTIIRALRRIHDATSQSLKQKYGVTDKNVTAAIMEQHGIDKERFDFVSNIEEFISKGMTDTSIDVNANKTDISVAGLLTETYAPLSKLIGFRYLYRKMKDMYGKKESGRLSGEMYDMSLAIADSSKLMLPYCFAVDASKLVMQGREFGALPSKPPKHLTSYIAALNETIHQLSNHLAGAVAISSYFLDVAVVLKDRENYTLADLDKPEVVKYIENCYQSFVHSVNHLSRNSVESPFTNISIFDRQKLKTMLDPSNMGWYLEATEENISYVMRLQEIFMDFFDRGDPCNNGRPYRFPVCTINVSKNTNNELQDPEFVDKISHNEIYRYNVLVSEGSKTASCCRLLNNFELMELGGQMNSFGGAGISLGSHRVVTINLHRIALESNSRAEYFCRLDRRIEDASKILEAHRSMLKDTISRGMQPFMKNGWLRIDRMFSTFGFIGIVEAATTLGEDGDFIGDILRCLNSKAQEISARTKNIYNIEQIPGESMAVKLAAVDRIIYGEEDVPHSMYSNQFIPLWEDATIWERMETDGKYNRLITGGGIVHFNLGERLTPTQVKQLITFATTSGCEHFALNSVYSECENKHNHFGNIDVCPVCQGQITTKFTRVVGFFTPVSSWNKTRREWEFPKREYTSI